MHDSPHAMDVRAQGASIVQVGITEKTLFLLVLFVLGVALIVSIWALVRTSDARADVAELEMTVRSLTGEVRVAQYDLNQARAQLMAQGIIDNTGH